MRLTQFEIDAIKASAKKVFGENTGVILFGSRVDDTKRGGDIDLYITSQVQENLYELKLKFLVDLKLKIGDQKIDVVIAKDPARLIEQVALRDGIKL